MSSSASVIHYFYSSASDSKWTRCARSFLMVFVWPPLPSHCLPTSHLLHWLRVIINFSMMFQNHCLMSSPTTRRLQFHTGNRYIYPIPTSKKAFYHIRFIAEKSHCRRRVSWIYGYLKGFLNGMATVLEPGQSLQGGQYVQENLSWMTH